MMPAPRLDTNGSVNTATWRVAYPLKLHNDESLAAVSATEPGGAFIEGLVRRLPTGRMSHSAIECDGQMARCLEARLLVAAGT